MPESHQFHQRMETELIGNSTRQAEAASQKFAAEALQSSPNNSHSVRESAAAPAKDISVANGLRFMETAQYKQEFAAAIAGAKQDISENRGNKNLAIVSDLDETLFDNSPYFRTHVNEDSPKAFREWSDEGKAPVLKQTADFLTWAHDQHVPIFFVTARSEDQRASTIKNLANDGISYDGLIMRPKGDNDASAVLKAGLRHQIADAGFKTILSIGDQNSDMTGANAQYRIKLPNKFYFVP